MDIAISIIIPVFNAEKYLDACISSLVNQTFKAIEFIFINDGSTDNSLSIIKQFALNDDRIIYKDQKNAGVSIARNEGLSVANGKYIGFVDADDWVEPEMYETLYHEIQSTKSDVVVCNMINNVNGVDCVHKYPFLTDIALTGNAIEHEIIPHLIKYDDLYSSCNKLFKKSIIEDNSIVFPPKNALSEDNIFNLRYFSKIRSFKYVDYAGYNYREVEGSATRNLATHDYFENVLAIFNFDYKSCLNLTMSEQELQQLKAEKLIKNVLSLIHIYFKDSQQLSFLKRVSYIKKMIRNEDVQYTIKKYYNFLTENQSKYIKFLMHAIRDKSVLRLYIGTKYSMLRNR